MADDLYYVYAYLRKKSNLPYYIGKGKGNRAYNKHKHISVPNDIDKIIFIKKNLSEEEAFNLEKQLIKEYGRKDIDKNGILLNISEGGRGGFNIPPEKYNLWRNKLSKKLKQKTSDSDFWKKGIEAMANITRGTKQTEAHKRKRSIAKQREVEIEGIFYKSGKEAASILGYSTSTISVWVSKNGSRYGIKIPKGSNQYKKR